MVLWQCCGRRFRGRSHGNILVGLTPDASVESKATLLEDDFLTDLFVFVEAAEAAERVSSVLDRKHLRYAGKLF